jgi:hypothetical protein
MEAVLIYLGKMILCSGVLFAYYRLVLYNEKFNVWNRFYLLASVLLSIVIPLLRFNFFTQKQPPLLLNLFVAPSDVSQYPTGYAPNNSFAFLWVIALLISAVLFLKLVVSIIKIGRMYSKGCITKIQDVKVIITNEQAAPFSFFEWLFWRSNLDANTKEGNHILKHELAHITQKHSLDKIAMELCLIVFWMNPIYWLIRKELSIIHEFLADNKCIENHDGAAFATMLLTATNNYPNQPISNHFFNNQIKRRLYMITTNKQSKYSYIRRISGLFLMATIALALTISIQYVQAQKTPKEDVPKNKLVEVTDTKGVKHSFMSSDVKTISITTNNADKKGKITLKNGSIILLNGQEVNHFEQQVPPPPPPPEPPTKAAKHLPAVEERKIAINGTLEAMTPLANITNELIEVPMEVTIDKLTEVPMEVPLVAIKNTPQKINTPPPPPALAKYATTPDRPTPPPPPAKYATTPDRPTPPPALAKYATKPDRPTPPTAPAKYATTQDRPTPPLPPAKYTVNIKEEKITTSSINNNILYIIDGVEAEMETIKNMLPTNIESIQVIKGDNATNKYGDKGKNGVIIITSKKVVS